MDDVDILDDDDHLDNDLGNDDLDNKDNTDEDNVDVHGGGEGRKVVVQLSTRLLLIFMRQYEQQ